MKRSCFQDLGGLGGLIFLVLLSPVASRVLPPLRGIITAAFGVDTLGNNRLHGAVRMA